MDNQKTTNNAAPITNETPLPRAAPTTPYRGKPSQPLTKTNMKKIANKFACQTLDHEKDIEGRYSVFSNVGLLPASIIDLNISKIREGAWNIVSEVQNNSFKKHLIGAAVTTYLQSTQSINLNVLITYSDALYFFGKWYLQLWAESIGKENKGITPIHSVGTTDQHSQLQLYLDGPKNKP